MSRQSVGLALPTGTSGVEIVLERLLTAASEPELGGVLVICVVCERTDGPFKDADEAGATAATHDALLHEGQPTADVMPRTACEACGRSPATSTWSQPGAGAPFALCAQCYPVAVTTVSEPPGQGVWW